MPEQKTHEDTPTLRFPQGWYPDTASTLPQAQITARLEGLYRMEQSQWWSPEALRVHQFNQLRDLLEHAWRTVPYYRSSLAAAGYEPGMPLDDEIWQALPLLTRADIQGAGEQLVSTDIPASHGSTYVLDTSGSTGEPVRVKGTGLVAAYLDVLTLRNHFWHRRDLSRVLASIRIFDTDKALPPAGMRSLHWGNATHGVFRTGPALGLDIHADIPDQVDWLRRNPAHYLLTYPSNLQALAEYCLEQGTGLPGLKEVITVSEIVPASLRGLCREAWGVGLADIYSSKEFGYIALQCPQHEHYHVQSESVLVEVLDDNGMPCQPGATGRLVITALHNYAMPLIRYEIRDLAEVGDQCPCGRGLPVIKRILGRTRNLVTLPNGERHWPLVGFSSFRDVAPVRQFQFIQTSLQEILARLVVERPLTGGEENALREIIRDRLGYPFDIRFEYPERIPRTAAGKYEEFISQLTRGGGTGRQ